MLNHVTLAVVAHTQKVTFHRTRNKCKREYVLLEVALHDIAYLVRNACNANARVQSGAAPGHARAPATWLLQYATRCASARAQQHSNMLSV